MDLIQEDTSNQYQLLSCFLQRNIFEGGPSLIIPRAESLHIKGLEALVRQRILAEDGFTVMRVLDLAVLYYKSAHPFHEDVTKDCG